MTEKSFLHDLRRGLGSAIIELKQNPEREKYKELVLRCCLKDIAYDPQCEGTKGYYLCSAIWALGCQDEFLGPITAAYQKRLPHRLADQLTDMLKVYIWNGSADALAALQAKYDQLAEQLKRQRTFPHRFWEREQFEYLMIDMMDYGNWKAFKKAVKDVGAIILARNDDLCSCYDWFLGRAEKRFGTEKVWKYLNEASASSEHVQAFIGEHKRFEDMRKNYQMSLTPVTLDGLIVEAREEKPDGRVYRLTGHCMQFARQASGEALIRLARFIEAEQNPDVQERLLRVFRQVDYPLDIEVLLKLASSSESNLNNTALDTLERFKDDRVRRLAVELIEKGDLDSGLPLLKENWQKADELLIRQAVMKSKRVSHAMQMDIRHIFSKHRSKTCGDILYHIYKNGLCSYCRSDIVKAMGQNGVLSDRVLLECQYDSYDETRQYAKRLIKRRGLEA